MTAAQNLWDPIRSLRDLGTVDISPTVSVNAAGDEKQTATLTVSLSVGGCLGLRQVLREADLWPDTAKALLEFVENHNVGRHALTLGVDDASLMAGLLDDDGTWLLLVTELRKALGLAGCWVEFQDGTL